MNRSKRVVAFNWYGYKIKVVHDEDSIVHIYHIFNGKQYLVVRLGLRPALSDYGLKLTACAFLDRHYKPRKIPLYESQRKRMHPDITL